MRITDLFYNYERGCSNQSEEENNKDKKIIYQKVIEGDFYCVYKVYSKSKRVLLTRYKIKNINNYDDNHIYNSNLDIIKEAKKLKDIYETNYNLNKKLDKEEDRKNTSSEDKDLIVILNSINENSGFELL